MELGYIMKDQGTGKNLFAIMRFHYNYYQDSLSQFYYHWGKEEHPLYRGICKIEVRFIEVPLYLLIKLINFIANEDLNKGHHFCKVIKTVKL